MEQGRCSLTPRTQRRSQNIVLTSQRYIIIWLLPNKIVLFYFSSPSMDHSVIDEVACQSKKPSFLVIKEIKRRTPNPFRAPSQIRRVLMSPESSSLFSK